ncbi:hypothetical protein GYH30_051109 [Glycine max]|nr:hypothetical protein GYH30_051109 [Glycine max]
MTTKNLFLPIELIGLILLRLPLRPHHPFLDSFSNQVNSPFIPLIRIWIQCV